MFLCLLKSIALGIRILVTSYCFEDKKIKEVELLN